MSKQLSVFSFHNSDVRIQLLNNEPLFCLTDITEILSIKNANASRFNLSEAGIHKMYIRSGGQKRDVTFINEPNLYRVIFRSNKKEALEFQSWVFDEVLPTIRKTGSYTLTINSEQQQAIREAVKNRTQRTGEKYAAVYARFYNHFKIPRYQALPASQFDEAVEYLGSVNNELVQFTNDELCNMCWCYKASELMRQKLEQTADGMIKLKSDYAASFYTMSIEYRRLLESVRFLLESKTRNIQPKIEGFQSDNWQNVLMFIREKK